MDEKKRAWNFSSLLLGIDKVTLSMTHISIYLHWYIFLMRWMVKTCSKVMIWHVIQVVKCIFLIRIKTEFFFLENAKGLRFIRFKEFYKKNAEAHELGITRQRSALPSHTRKHGPQCHVADYSRTRQLSFCAPASIHSSVVCLIIRSSWCTGGGFLPKASGVLFLPNLTCHHHE
jgi:hypothetical protein